MRRYVVVVGVVAAVGCYWHRETVYEGFSRSAALAVYREHAELDRQLPGGYEHRTTLKRSRAVVEPIRTRVPQQRVAV